jgi:hypothetical protein
MLWNNKGRLASLMGAEFNTQLDMSAVSDGATMLKAFLNKGTNASRLHEKILAAGFEKTR